MRTLKLKIAPPKLAFVIGTRAALVAGIGLLVSGKLSDTLRKRLGIGLVSLGALTTLPAVRILSASAK
jgi:hypothetical protein